MKFRFYRSKLLSIYNNSSFQAWIMLKVVYLVFVCFILILKTTELFYPMQVFLLPVCACERSVFPKHLSRGTWHRMRTKPRSQPEAWVGGQRCTSAKIRWPRFFWDQEGILLTDYLPKGQTINAEYYSSLLVQMKDILKEKRRSKVTKMVLFLHDNAPAHRALATQKKLAYLGYQCLNHPPYSPDLAPSD